MADADVLPASRTGRLIERLRTSAAVIAAVAGAITGLWTIYEKVRADARQYTAASYDTLAPQVNQMAEAVRQLAEENLQMRQALAAHAENPRTISRERAAAAHNPPAKPTPPAGTEPAPGATATAPPAQADPADPLGKLIGTVNRTREAVDAVRKVPETFDKAFAQRPR
jgi:hypothetical protein